MDRELDPSEHRSNESRLINRKSIILIVMIVGTLYAALACRDEVPASTVQSIAADNVIHYALVDDSNTATSTLRELWAPAQGMTSGVRIHEPAGKLKVTGAVVATDELGYSGVSVVLAYDGGQFARFVTENHGKVTAFVVDGKVVSTAAFLGYVDGGRLSIAQGLSVEDAIRLKNRLIAK